MNKLKVYSCEGWKRERGGIEEAEIEKMERRGREKRMRERVSSVRGR
jgi:cyclopropane fatty-acyl-phospholipid synthase-like methyltransferase